MTHRHDTLSGLFHSHTHGHTQTHFEHADARGGVGVPTHFRGVVLPGGEPSDLWVHDAVISTEPVPGAVSVSTSGWIMPGLVDAHSHIGLDQHGAIDQAQTLQQALDERDAGVLLVRDAGSPSDTRWVDQRHDLPKIIRAGRHIAAPRRYIRDYAAEVDPSELVDEVKRQAQAGDGWVKLVGDWIDRSQGDLAPLWPTEIAREAIAAAHLVGARVTAHCFGEESVASLVEAGIDGIEHGTGISDEVIELMAARQVALVPTMINLENFPAIAAQAEVKFPTYARHMRALHASRFEVLGKAREAGVPIYAGTDAGGVMAHGLIGDEIIALSKISNPEYALGAASWRARDWLGHELLTQGAPADFVVFDQDPRGDLHVVKHPRFVVLGGEVYRV